MCRVELFECCGGNDDGVNKWGLMKPAIRRLGREEWVVYDRGGAEGGGGGGS